MKNLAIMVMGTGAPIMSGLELHPLTKSGIDIIHQTT